jgi:hypothetical protein
MHLVFQISRCGLFLSSIPIYNNPVALSLETWLANCGDRHVRYIRETIVQKLYNHVKNEEELRYFGSIWTSFIPRNIFQKSGQFLLQNS